MDGHHIFSVFFGFWIKPRTGIPRRLDEPFFSSYMDFIIPGVRIDTLRLCLDGRSRS